MTPQDILPTYDRVGPAWAAQRNRALFERRWLDRMLAHTPLNGARRRVLDLGCGGGRPIATYLVDRGVAVTGVDGAASMVDLFQRQVPQARAVQADMRGLDLEERFDAILAWDSFFHLSPEDQRPMFATFADHAASRGVLMFTSGHKAGEAVGQVEGEPVYHASLDPDDYRDLLDKAGFEVLAFAPEDPDCDYHTIWLARLRA